MSTEKWVKNYNESMREFYRKYYGNLVESDQIKNHATISSKSTLLKDWLLPGKRIKFLNDFLVKNVTKGYFDGTQWQEISQILAELKKQRKVSKIGFNSLKVAARVLGINYDKAKKYMKEIPNSIQKRWSLGRIIPKLTPQNKLDRLKFCEAFENGTLQAEQMIISGKGFSLDVLQCLLIILFHYDPSKN